MPKLPDEVYLYWNEDEKDSPFLLADEDLLGAAESAEEDTFIGTYELKHKAKYGIDKTVNEL
jgi:hypothetical protein